MYLKRVWNLKWSNIKLAIPRHFCYYYFFFVKKGAALEGDAKEKLVAVTKQCIQSTGVNEELVLKGRKGEFVEDPKLIEYYYCVFKTLDFINDAGVLNEQALREKLPINADKEKADALFAKCAAIKGDSPQKTAYLAHKCYKENSDFVLL